MRTFLRKYLSDWLIFTGCGLVIYATWLVNWIAAIYLIGIILIILGVLIGIGDGMNT